MTGVKSDLSEKDFYDNCANGILDKGNILTRQKYNCGTLKRKSDQIENIHELMYAEGKKTLLLEKLKVNTCVFPVAIKNDEVDTCVGFVSDKNKARSLRNAKNATECESEKEE